MEETVIKVIVIKLIILVSFKFHISLYNYFILECVTRLILLRCNLLDINSSSYKLRFNTKINVIIIQYNLYCNYL